MHSDANNVFSGLLPTLKKTGKKLIVPQSCVDELQKMKKDQDRCEKAKKAIRLLSNYKDYIERRGETSDGEFADKVFHVVFTKFRTTNTLLLISEDRNLCKEILQLNNSKSVKGKRIYAFNCKQVLSNTVESNGQKESSSKKEQKNSQETIKLTTIPDDVVVPNPIPKQGDYVYTKEGAKIKLIEDFKAGGEGTVYKMDATSDYVAKIYHKGKLDKRKASKINILMTKGNTSDRICMPVEMLYNEKKEFVGYTMKLVSGRSLDGTIFKGEKGFNRFFENWDRNDLIDFCINLLSTINTIHKQGMLIGDINGANILVKTPQDFCIIDTDSFQVYGFPCPVGKEEFTAPEIQGKAYNSFLRTLGNENFAVATLLFKILMFGVHPYQQLGGDDIVKEIKKGEFSFPYKGNSNKKIPNGNWCYFWSHLHPKVKEMFYQTFKKGERSYEEHKRPAVMDWIKVMNIYKQNLNDGYLARVDEESLKLFPKTYKKISGHEYKECKICGKVCDASYMTNGVFCSDCLRGSSELICKKCHESFQYSNYKRFILQKKEPSLCSNCWMQQLEEKRKREQRNSVYEKRYCCTCGKEFTITNGEYDYHRQKGLDLPKRCQSCRTANRYKPQLDTVDVWPEPKPKKKDSGFCFLTTAACEFYGKDDNCIELTTLRQFRDNWLLHQNGGEQDILHYYEIAPKLVEAMKNSSDYAETCEIIMNKYILPCVALIQEKRNEECRSKYIELINFMTNRYN